MAEDFRVLGKKLSNRVGCVAPATKDSRMLRKNLGAGPKAFAHRVERVPMERLGQPEEQAQAMLFLMSDATYHISGHTIPVNGGQMPVHSRCSAKFSATLAQD